MKVHHLAMLLTAVLAACAAARADLPRGVEARIRKAWEAQTGLRADVRLSAMMQAGVHLLQVTGEGTLEVLRDEDTERWRQVLTVSIPDPVGAESRHVAVFDGETLRLTSGVLGREETVEAPNDIGRGVAPPGGAPLLEALEAGLTLNLLREDAVDGRAVYVIEGLPKGGAGEFTRGVFYIDQATGLQLRQEIYADQNLAPRVVILVEKVQVGAAVDPGVFAADGAGDEAPAGE